MLQSFVTVYIYYTITYFIRMTLYNFNRIDLNKRMEVINQHGIFLDKYITENEKLNLYAVDMFFVEVVYNSTLNKITKIRSFKTGKNLNKYSIDFTKGF